MTGREKYKFVKKRMTEPRYLLRCVLLVFFMFVHAQYPEHIISNLHDLFYWPEGINWNFVAVWGCIICMVSMLKYQRDVLFECVKEDSL